MMKSNIRRYTKAVIGRLAGLRGTYAKQFGTHTTIVAFHRVIDSLDPDGITCSASQFEAFCSFFSKYFRVVPLSHQIQCCRVGQDLGGTLSITFDDGYLDNLEVAAPILLKLKLPATFFVTTSFIGSKTVPFWDRELPNHPGWMNWDQVRRLRELGFEIGNHTDTHINMRDADAELIRLELARSRSTLIRELGIDSDLFAYPFGGRMDITPSARQLVREAGFSCCLSCFGGVNSSRPDPFDLKRIGIAEWFKTPHQFGYELLAGKA
jgi:peptidoglycan/xylan/chitin deacetylase (PgdA/CDA1 family)